MQLALIRHLPTKWNQQGLLQGRKNIPLEDLSQEYLRGIEENNRILKEIGPFEIVLTSSLVRTQETANYYGYHRDFYVESLLDELDFGEFEGQQKKLLLERYNDEWLNNPRELVLGEGLIDFEKRILSFLGKYNKCSNLLIFGHGSWIRAMISISQIGTIKNMNQVEVPNNHITVLNIS